MFAPEPQADERQRNEEIVKLFVYLFHGVFTPQENIPEAQSYQVLPAYFFGWCREFFETADHAEVCTKANVTYEIWEAAKQIVDGGLAPERMSDVWYTIVLAKRKPPVHAIKSVNMNVLVTYQDGTIMPINAFVARDMFAGNGNFTDGLVCSFLRKYLPIVIEQIAKDGVDKLHDEAAKANTFTCATEPEDPYEVAMGLILTGIPHVKPALQAPVKQYMRLIQTLIRPVYKIIDPPKTQQQLTQEHNALRSKLGGGWVQ